MRKLTLSELEQYLREIEGAPDVLTEALLKGKRRDQLWTD